MSIRYTADYRALNRLYFRCVLELDSEGWSAHIFDLHPIDKRATKPIETFCRYIDDPDAAMATVQVTLAEMLKCKGLPNKPLTWKKSS